MKKTIILLILILALSCNSDNDQTNNTSLNLVTGVNFRQSADDLSLQLGNPNVLVNDKFIMYPNPAIETLQIVTQENVSDIWIVTAKPEKIYQDLDFSNVLNTNLYSEQSVIYNSEISLNGQSSDNIAMNIEGLEKGYYRVFVKIGGVLYWDNLYKNDDQGNSEEHIASLINFWN